MSIKNDKKNDVGLDSENLNGYLICHSCHGYYQLNENESPDDFNACECGGSLLYAESVDDILESPSNFSDKKDYEDLEEVVDFLKNEARERKELLKNLSERVTIQEQTLDNINKENILEINDNSSVWDMIDDKDLGYEIIHQKNIIESDIGHEERFISHIQQKRSKSNASLYTGNSYSSLLLTGSIVVILLILFIIALYVI